MTREEAIKTIENAKHFAYDDVYTKAFDMAIKALEQEPRKAHWIEHPHEAGPNWEYSMYECSECHGWLEDDSDYCPDCGAKMEREET